MFSQTSRNGANEIKGSLLAEIRTYGSNGDFTSCGACSGFKVDKKMDIAKVERDNTATDYELSDVSAEIAFTLYELANTAILGILTGDNYVVTPGVAATKNQQFVAVPGYGYSIKAIDADGSAPTVNSCKTSGEANYTDYEMINVGGNYLIKFKDAGTYNLVFGYTEIASVSCDFGAQTELPYFELRTTNKSVNGTEIETFHKCILNGGFSIDYQKDTGGDRAARSAIKINAVPDPAHVAPNGNFITSSKQRIAA